MSIPSGSRVDVAEIQSPIGPLAVAVFKDRLRALAFGGIVALADGPAGRVLPATALREAEDPGGVVLRLRAYFAGLLGALDEIEVEPAGTPFQLRVWTALRRIPVGRTWSYAELARAIGEPTAVRAVGAANGANPVAVVIPCHRVIGSDGRLVGYGGGLERKRWLLRHEGAAVRDDGPPALPLFGSAAASGG